MRYNSPIGEFLSSVKRVGLFNTIELVVNRFDDSMFDKKYQLDTSKRLEVDELDIYEEDPELAKKGQMYQPTSVRSFKKILKKLSFIKDKKVVDYGCGKARTLAVCLLNGVNDVVGVEFSQELCDSAESNMKKMETLLPTKFSWKIHCGDAALYQVQPDENIFYFFFPFDETITRKVIANILESVKGNKREIVIVYYYAIHRAVVEEFEAIYIHQEFNLNGYDCILYRVNHDKL